jgi:hypothetical protein
METKEKIGAIFAFLLYTGLIIIACAAIHHYRCRCPQLEEVYWMQEPIDTLNITKEKTLIRDANGHYFTFPTNR